MVLSDAAASIVFATAAYKDLLEMRLDADQMFDCIDDLGLLACFAEYYKLALHAAHQRGGTDDTREIITNNCTTLVAWLRAEVCPRLAFKEVDELDVNNSSADAADMAPPIVY